ncbi:MAG TPA: pirin-like C-terminal cupin domain-containing protein [Polyangia bacterium]|jgi:hypothetical protein
MSNPRELARVITLPSPSPGQFGPDHTAIEVIRPGQWADADPFILLMDDRVDGTLQGGPHPHAGFETVSFLVHGSLGAESGEGQLAPGDVEWTTAGSGIVHGSTSRKDGRMRLLQLWLTLPKADRWTEPDHQMVPAASAPVRREAGAELRLFSGSTGTLRSPTRNRVPITLVDMRLEAGAVVEQTLPVDHNGFFYVLEGKAAIGVEATPLTTGQIGWLDRNDAAPGESNIRVANPGDEPLRVLLYAGQRQNVPIVSYGPFIGDTRQDIVRSFERYQSGTFRHY